MLNLGINIHFSYLLVFIFLVSSCNFGKNHYDIDLLENETEKIFLKQVGNPCGSIDSVRFVTLEKKITFLSSLYRKCPFETGIFDDSKYDYNIQVINEKDIFVEDYVGDYKIFMNNLKQNISYKINFTLTENNINDEILIGLSRLIEELLLRDKNTKMSFQLYTPPDLSTPNKQTK